MLRLLVVMGILGWGYFVFPSVNRMSEPSTAILLIAVFVAVAIFQLSLVLGAPFGEFTQGGSTVGELEPRQKQLAAFSILVLLIFAATVASHLAVLNLVSPASVQNTLQIITLVYTTLGAVVNGISRSPKESALWTPVLLLSFALSASLYV